LRAGGADHGKSRNCKSEKSEKMKNVAAPEKSFLFYVNTPFEIFRICKTEKTSEKKGQNCEKIAKNRHFGEFWPFQGAWKRDPGAKLQKFQKCPGAKIGSEQKYRRDAGWYRGPEAKMAELRGKIAKGGKNKQKSRKWLGLSSSAHFRGRINGDRIGSGKNRAGISRKHAKMQNRVFRKNGSI